MEMEEYINERTIIKNDTFDSCREQIICQICGRIMLEPVMCVNCQNFYCKECIEDWKKKNKLFPNSCEKPSYINVKEKNRLITKMKFKCIKGCGAEILFEDIKKHYSTNCLENIKDNIIEINDINKKNDKVEKKSNIKMLSKNEVLELKKSGKNYKPQYITSNYISFFKLYFFYSNYIRGFRSWKNCLNK